VAAVLERSAQAQRGDARLAADLAALGPASAPDLFTVLAFGSGLERALRGPEEEALADALASFGVGPLRTLLKRRLTASAPTEERLAALQVLERVGSSLDVPFVRLAVPGSSSNLAPALQETCLAILRRDPRALEALRRWMLEAPIETGAALAAAVGESSGPQALQALTSTLGFRDDLDAELLAAIAPLAARAPKPLEEELLRPIEDALEGDDVHVLRGAALALGHAEDAGALPALIGLAQHESRAVTTAVAWALTEITGLRLHDAERWRAWLRAESSWFEAEGPRLRFELRSGKAEIAIRALGELSSHRLRRHELALLALAALEHRDPAVRRLACLAVARLGSRAAEPGLLRAIEDPDESVARGARQALEALGLAAPDPAGRSALLGEGSRNPPHRPTNRQRWA
jgi:hypothetical protein